MLSFGPLAKDSCIRRTTSIRSTNHATQPKIRHKNAEMDSKIKDMRTGNDSQIPTIYQHEKSSMGSLLTRRTLGQGGINIP